MTRVAEQTSAEPERFFISRAVGGWSVRDSAEAHGPYLSRWDAFLDAVDAAHSAAEGGRPAQVLDSVGGKGETVLWCSQNDSYPPTSPGGARPDGSAD